MTLMQFIGDFFPAAFNCPHEIERVGALGDGGKWVCGMSRVVSKPDCIIYSVGINHESSFEAELLSRTDNCQVWGYDFSVHQFGPEVQDSPALLRRAHFKPYGLAGTNAHGPEDTNKMYTLQSLMALNGHTHIDILKVDIESWEFETLSTLIKSYLNEDKPLPFGQLQLEIHVWDKKFPEMLKWWETLEDAGLRPFWTEVSSLQTKWVQVCSDVLVLCFLKAQLGLRQLQQGWFAGACRILLPQHRWFQCLHFK